MSVYGATNLMRLPRICKLCSNVSVLSFPVVVTQVGQVLHGIQSEREKVRQALESESNLLASHNTTTIIAALRNSLNQVS